MEAQERRALLARTPPPIRQANMLILLYGLLMIVDALISGFRFGLWWGFARSFAFGFVAAAVAGGLVMNRPKGWWVAAAASLFVAWRTAIGLGAWSLIRREGRVLDVQRPIFHAVGLILALATLALLLRRSGRAYSLSARPAAPDVSGATRRP